MKDKKIIYVNYSPYENLGSILDFLIEEYKYVFAFSIGHHNLGKKERSNKITIYENKKIIKEINLHFLYVSSRFVYAILPFRSLLNIFQIIWQCIRLRKEYGRLDIYFTVNGFTAWIGLVVRALGLVDKTLYWVCDYYPIINKNKTIQTMRWIYWQFEKRTTGSDRLTFHNDRIVQVWKKHKLLPEDYKQILIPASTGKIIEKINTIRKNKKLRLCFLGVLKRSMGLDYIFDSADVLSKNFPGIVIEIIGPGPDEDYFRQRAKKTKATFNFYGYLSEDEVDNILSNSTIGLAPYMPDPSHVSYYADSAKMKKYVSLGLPIIATKIHEFSEEVEKMNAGIMISYGDPRQLVDAIRKVNANYARMKKNVMLLNNKYFYKNIYPKMFEFDKKIGN